MRSSIRPMSLIGQFVGRNSIHMEELMKLNIRVPLTVIFGLVLTVAATRAAQGQTLRVLHNFSGGADGYGPFTGLTPNGAGNFYGTTQGYPYSSGNVFKLTHNGSGWIMTPLYTFSDGIDGGYPESRVIFGPDGGPYGTTDAGG